MQLLGDRISEAYAPRAEGRSAGQVQIIINADDWGLNRNVTHRTLECIRRGVLSSVSAMVFMQDSARAAAIAREHSIDAGLHLNLTSPFTCESCGPSLGSHQQRIARFLRRSRFSQAIYHPGLAHSFEYVVQAQLDEFERLYGSEAARVDGHHHMHLCANVEFQQLLPLGAVVRRNFSFRRREKNAAELFYRRWQDRRLAKRHRMVDFFFSLPPMDIPGRLERIFRLASQFTVELETHSANDDEYDFLISGEFARRSGSIQIARGYAVA